MRIPTSTYRIQFNPSFGFAAAREIIPYLAELGISDLYASPIFKARKGSLHGYDVVDPNRLNPELGEWSDFEHLTAALKRHEMGWLQDIVPNHMAFDYDNRMLVDLLENGPSSQYFPFFDIEWDHPYESLKGRVLAPFLGSYYGEALERGEIGLTYGADGFAVTYYEWLFPLRIESYGNLLTHRLGGLKRKLGRDHPDFIKLLGILYVIRTLPPEAEVTERYDQIHFVKGILWELYNNDPEIRRFIDRNIELFKGEQGNPESFTLLDSLLSEQFFRVSFWKVATEEINYRRFFSINELISLKVEDKAVLNRTHALIFKLVDDEKITGLRIDHIDGLYDPAAYLDTLRERTRETYIVAEKILDLNEPLPPFWPIQGTSGYDFVNYVNGLFCANRNEKAMTGIYTRFTGADSDYENLVSEKKRLIIGKHMAGDIDNLAHLLKRISSRYRYGSDTTLYGLRRGLVEVMAHFPVYRTYINKKQVRDGDARYMETAVEKAKESNPGLIQELALIQRFLLLQLGAYISEEEKDQCVHFVMRFQQFTGPLMAKGFEDTALYVYNRLLSLNEVGGDPGRFGISLREFHDFNQNRATLWPAKLNATSTHDTKRGEDVRARINVISEMPGEWETHVRTWRRLNSKKKRRVKRIAVPDKNDEYFLYQTLVGAYPFDETEYPAFVARLKEYAIKAVREAKVHTAWLKPDSEYEDAYLSFIEAIMKAPEDHPFLGEFLPFQRKIALYGVWNSLSQTITKLTSPGVPDFYQGTELWDLSLVDPDNRRPVDFEERRAMLREIQEKSHSGVLDLIGELLHSRQDGRIKMFLVYRALRARKEHPAIFQKGAYTPLPVAGEHKDHLIAFARQAGERTAVTLAPRFFTSLVPEDEYPLGPEIWSETRVVFPEAYPRRWRDAITDQSARIEGEAMVGDVLRHFPVALLLSEANS